MPRERQHKLNVDEETKERAIRISKRTQIPMIDTAGYLYEMCEKHDMTRPGWEDRMEKADQERERYTLLDGSCPALAFADKVWKCLWGQDGKPPAIKTLAKDINEAKKLCAACTKTLNIKLENESYQVKVQELEMKLQEQSTKKFKIPQCKNGARLDNDGLSFEGCPRSIGKPVSVEGYCKKINDGRGCDWFKSRLVGVSSEA